MRRFDDGIPGRPAWWAADTCRRESADRWADRSAAVLPWSQPCCPRAATGRSAAVRRRCRAGRCSLDHSRNAEIAICKLAGTSQKVQLHTRWLTDSKQSPCKWHLDWFSSFSIASLPPTYSSNILQVYSAPNSGAKYFVATVSWMTWRFSHNGALIDQNQRWRYDSSSLLGGGTGIEDADYDWRLVSDASCRTLISSWQDFNGQRASCSLSAIVEPLVILAAVHPRPVCPSLAWIRPNNNNIFTCEVKGWPHSEDTKSQLMSWTAPFHRGAFCPTQQRAVWHHSATQQLAAMEP